MKSLDEVIAWIADRAAEEVRHRITDDIPPLASKAESPIEKAFAWALETYFCYWTVDLEYRYDPNNTIESMKERSTINVGGLPTLVCAAQVKIGEYRVDFCFSIKNGAENKCHFLVVECDGHHFHERTREQAVKDRSRDRWLQQQGFAVFRFTGSEIWRDPLNCAKQVANWASDRAWANV